METLSEKRTCGDGDFYFTDVKEFIRELKTNLVLVNTVDDSFIETMNERMYRIIDKLAGDKLV